MDTTKRILREASDTRATILAEAQRSLQDPLFNTTELVTQPTPKTRKRVDRNNPADRGEAQTIDKLMGKLRALKEEMNKALYDARASERPTVHSPKDAYDILAPFMEPLEQEELWVILLDTRNRVISLETVYKGSLNSSQVRVGELFKAAIRHNAASIIVAHNHPSADPTPSPDDVAVTRAIVQAGKLLDVDVLDHMVLGSGRSVSLKERGLGFG